MLQSQKIKKGIMHKQNQQILDTCIIIIIDTKTQLFRAINPSQIAILYTASDRNRNKGLAVTVAV